MRTRWALLIAALSIGLAACEATTPVPDTEPALAFTEGVEQSDPVSTDARAEARGAGHWEYSDVEGGPVYLVTIREAGDTSTVPDGGDNDITLRRSGSGEDITINVGNSLTFRIEKPPEDDPTAWGRDDNNGLIGFKVTASHIGVDHVYFRWRDGQLRWISCGWDNAERVRGEDECVMQMPERPAAPPDVDTVGWDGADEVRTYTFQPINRRWVPDSDPHTDAETVLVVHSEDSSVEGRSTSDEDDFDYRLRGNTMLKVQGEIRDGTRSWPNAPYSELISIKVEVKYANSEGVSYGDWVQKSSITYFQNGYDPTTMINTSFCAEQLNVYCGYRLLRRPAYTYKNGYPDIKDEDGNPVLDEDGETLLNEDGETLVRTYKGRFIERVRFTLVHPHAPNVDPVVIATFDDDGRDAFAPLPPLPEEEEEEA